MVKFKNIILFSPEWRVRRWQGKRKTISNNGNLDPRVADGILAGENDFKISSLDKMAGALNLIYVMIPIPTNSVRYAVSDSGDMRSLVFQVFLRLQS